jgi:hypothetical protein
MDYRFDLKELWFLLEQFTPATIVGIKNPYVGWLAEETELIQREALKSLVDRDLVRMIANDEIALEESVASLVDVCAHADHSLITNWWHCHNDRQSYAYFADGLIVEIIEIEPGIYNLSSLENTNALSQSLMDAIYSSASSSGESFQLLLELLESTRSLCQEGKSAEAQKILEEGSKLKSKEINRLLKALAATVANSSFVLLANRNSPDAQYVSGFAVLEGQDDLWVMQVDEQNGKRMVTFNPANANMVLEHFLEIMPAGYRDR